jgi:hypothetical protein
MACSVTKFAWNFAIYCGKMEDTKEVAQVACGELHLPYKVVLDLAVDVEGKEHVLSIDNFFTSIGLFKELASKKIYATCIVRTNQVGLPLILKNTGAFKNVPQGTLQCRIYKL